MAGWELPSPSIFFHPSTETLSLRVGLDTSPVGLLVELSWFPSRHEPNKISHPE